MVVPTDPIKGRRERELGKGRRKGKERRGKRKGRRRDGKERKEEGMRNWDAPLLLGDDATDAG